MIAAGAAGAVFTGMRQQNGGVATATISATVVAAAPTTQATATAATRPTATGPSAATQIVITAPPIVITATPAPVPSATPVPPPVPAATVTSQPVVPIPFPTVLPASSGSVITWTDPQNRIRLAYPGTWSVVRLTDRNEIFEVDSGDAAHFDAYTTQSLPNETPMSAVFNYRDRQSQRTDRTYNFGAPFTGTLGGKSAAFLPFTSTSRTNQADTRIVQAAYAMSSGWTFLFESFTDGPIWRHQDQLQAILQSIAFS